jgi:addiction module RelE/StbE family toxin
LDKYSVRLSPQAYRDIDEIYTYIKEELFAVKAAEDIADHLEDAILSLREFPERKVGRYAGLGYRQLFADHYIVIYRIDKSSRTVIVMTIKYAYRNF